MGDPWGDPLKSLQILRWGEGAEARKSVNFKSHQQSCFLITFLFKKAFFKDLYEHYTHDFSLPLHHNTPPPPHNKSGSFSTNMRLAEEHWMGDPWGDP